MATLQWTTGGQSVLTDGKAAKLVDYTETAHSADRFYGLTLADEGSWHLILTVRQKTKVDAVCPTREEAKTLAEAWEHIAVADGDQIHRVLVPDTEHGQRLVLAQIELAQKHQRQTLNDVRVSAVGTPAPAQGHQYYVVAYKTESLPMYAGGQQVYPRS